MHIAGRFLLPKQLKSNCLDTLHIIVTEPPLLHIVTRYTGGAGARSLEQAVGGVVRHKAVELAEHLDALTSQQECTASPFRGANMIELLRNMLTGRLGDVRAFFFASNCADVFTLFLSRFS